MKNSFNFSLIFYYISIIFIVLLIKMNIVFYKNNSIPDGGIVFWFPFFVYFLVFIINWKKFSYTNLNYINLFFVIILIKIALLLNSFFDVKHLFLLFPFVYCLLYYFLYFFKENYIIMIILRMFHFLNVNSVIFIYSFLVYVENGIIH